ncbi:MAG: single-stranded DNA-binding protein [Gammaproteobacteria bacterium]|jgi:single-strand DNA-binding protein|nr:single-stranded DNA-binding protein [Gammaproteobacteria bacterium]
MPNYNHTVIMGHLVRDPEEKHLPSGAALTECAIAVTKKWTNKNTQQKEERTMFLDLVIWGPSGERFAQWYKKGRAVMVAGELEQDSWEDKTSGAKRSKIKLNVRDHQAAGPEKAANGQSNNAHSQMSSTPQNVTSPLEETLPF